MFGGKENEFEYYTESLSNFLEHNYCIKDKKDDWKWMNGDLAFREWYIDFGNSIDFDMVHVLEWDLLYLAPIKVLYSHVHEQALGTSGLVPLRKIESEWFWTRDPEQRANWLKLVEHVGSTVGNVAELHGTVAPGLCMPKMFLQKYSEVEIPELVHDELRLPLYAEAFGFELVDTGFYKKWFSKGEYKYFNCNNFDIQLKRIYRHLKKRNGRRAFHPFREIIDIQEIKHKITKYNDYGLME